MDDVITDAGGVIYATPLDRTLHRPLDIARYLYVRAMWAFGSIDKIKKIEVWQNHAQAICFLSVDYLPEGKDELSNIQVILREDEATAPDAIASIVKERIDMIRMNINV